MGFDNLTNEQKAAAMKAYESEGKRKDKERRYWATVTITLRKAKAAGIIVSDAEINEYMKDMKRK